MRTLWTYALALAVILPLAACGSKEEAAIVERWTAEAPPRAAPPGLGPERRVLIASAEAPSTIRTVEEANGLTIEGPFDVFPTEHAPVTIGAEMFLVSSVGRIVGLSFAGDTKTMAPGELLGRTGPLAAGPDGLLRIAATSGRLLGIAPGGEVRFDVPIVGAAESRPAIADDGVTYLATDLGRLFGVSATGEVVLDQPLHAQGSGPSVAGDRIAVGEIDGLAIIDREGSELRRIARPARVVGTRILESGEILAWGEDGRVDLYGSDGDVVFSFNAGPPIYADVVPIGSDHFAVFDSEGGVDLIDRSGTSIASLELGAAPDPQIAAGEIGFVYVAVNDEVRALHFRLPE